MRLLVGALIVAAGCGRIGFEPTSRSDDDSTDGPTSSDDGDVPSIDAMPSIDSPPATACTAAIPVTVGVRSAHNTCEGSQNLIDGCATSPTTNEIVFVFDPPTSGGYMAGAYNPGTNNVSTDVSRATADCSAVSNCSGLFGTSYTAHQLAYFVIEASDGTCKDIEFLIQ